MVRIAIIETFQGLSEYLDGDKLPSITLIVTHMMAVLESNDPSARTLCLRALTTMPQLIACRLDVQHQVFRSLKSTNPAEVKSAVTALERICKVSSLFAKGHLFICLLFFLPPKPKSNFN